MERWVSGMFGAFVKGFFWLTYSFTGNVWGSIGITAGISICASATLYTLGKRCDRGIREPR